MITNDDEFNNAAKAVIQTAAKLAFIAAQRHKRDCPEDYEAYRKLHEAGAAEVYVNLGLIPEAPTLVLSYRIDGADHPFLSTTITPAPSTATH